MPLPVPPLPLAPMGFPTTFSPPLEDKVAMVVGAVEVGLYVPLPCSVRVKPVAVVVMWAEAVVADELLMVSVTDAKVTV